MRLSRTLAGSRGCVSLVPLLALTLLFATSVAHADPWAPAPVDTANGAGSSLELRIRPGGAPQIAYWNPFSGPIWHGVYNGASWQLEAVPVPVVGPGMEAASSGAGPTAPNSTQLLITYAVQLALDGGDQPWLATARHDCFGDCSGPVRVTHREGGHWVTELLENSYGQHSIAVSPTGVVTVAFQTTSGIRSARRVEGSWSYENLPATGTLAELCLAPDGEPRVLSYAGAFRLAIASRDASSWSLREVPAPAGTLARPSFAFTPNGHARLGLNELSADLTQRFLWVVREEADGSWTSEPVTEAGSHVNSVSLALGPAGDERIAFQDLSTKRARLARRTGSAWQVEDVDPTPFNSNHIDTQVDGDGRTWVAFGGTGLGLRSASALPVADVPGPATRSAFHLRLVGPNPTRASAGVALALDGAVAEVVRIEAFDVLGRRLADSGPLALPAGEVRLRLPWSVRGGLVVLRATGSSGRTATTRAVVLD